MLTLGELCDLTAGRVALVIELKSRFDGDLRLAQRAAKVLTGYKGPAAVMSFDPEPIGALRELGKPLGKMHARDFGRNGVILTTNVARRIGLGIKRVDVTELYDVNEYRPKIRHVLGKPMFLY